jgi:hypothetical protein
MPIMLQPLIDALTQLGLASGVARSASIYAAVSATHVLGIALLVGPIMLVDLRLLGLLRTLDAPVIAILRRTAMIGIIVAAVTGLLLLSAKPGDYAKNPFVPIKLAVIGLALANALAFEFWARRRTIDAILANRSALGFALISIMFWPLVILLGRLIAFA